MGAGRTTTAEDTGGVGRTVGGGGGGISEEFANRRRYDSSGESDLERAVIRSTMNAAKTKTSHIITGKKPPEKELRLGPDTEGQLKLDGFVDKLKRYADRNGDGNEMFKTPSQLGTTLEEIKQRISGPLSTAQRDDYGSFFHDDVTKLGFELVDDGEESEWAAFDEEPEDKDRVEVVNLVFAPEAVEDGDGTPLKIFPASELEKLKVKLADTALFFL